MTEFGQRVESNGIAEWYEEIPRLETTFPGPRNSPEMAGR
jgi:hypothetical protein